MATSYHAGPCRPARIVEDDSDKQLRVDLEAGDEFADMGEGEVAFAAPVHRTQRAKGGGGQRSDHRSHCVTGDPETSTFAEREDRINRASPNPYCEAGLEDTGST